MKTHREFGEAQAAEMTRLYALLSTMRDTRIVCRSCGDVVVAIGSTLSSEDVTRHTSSSPLGAGGVHRYQLQVQGGPDPRPAAEIMSDVAMPIVGPGLSGDCLFEEDGWRTYGWSLAGPLASQIFDAAVIQEQVDPR